MQRITMTCCLKTVVKRCFISLAPMDWSKLVTCRSTEAVELDAFDDADDADDE